MSTAKAYQYAHPLQVQNSYLTSKGKEQLSWSLEDSENDESPSFNQTIEPKADHMHLKGHREVKYCLFLFASNGKQQWSWTLEDSEKDMVASPSFIQTIELKAEHMHLKGHREVATLFI